MYRGYEIEKTVYGCFEIRDDSGHFGIHASLQKAKKYIDNLVEGIIED